MELYQICWQMVIGGRVETSERMPLSLAQFRLRDFSGTFQGVRFWLSGPDGEHHQQQLAPAE